MDGFPAIGRIVGGIVVVIAAIVILYYLYAFLYGSQGITSQKIITTPIDGNSTDKPLYPIPPIYEGGEYSVSFWLYITAFKDQVGRNKHILEIRGANQSTLLVGLGAFKNKLMVKVHTASEGTRGTSLTIPDVRKLFKDTQVPSGLLDEQTDLCDLPEVDLQRWVQISVVLNGRTVDVYSDGKLARSCVLPSFYKVDPKGVQMKLLDFDGFDGYLSDVSCYNYALNPDQVYRIYMSGPSDGAGSSFLDWLKTIFDVKGKVTYSYPQVGVKYESASYVF
jgi:hypothetical protein